MKAKTVVDQYAASDGKHYWNCWTSNYQPSRDGYCIHAWCEEDPGNRALCGVRSLDGGGVSYPSEGRPSCLKCERIMIKRGVLITLADTNRPSPVTSEHDASTSGKSLVRQVEV